MIDTSLPPEVAAARIGKLTASRVADATAKVASGRWGASRANYMAELVAERLTRVAAERFVSKEMLWGIEKEPEASAAYEWEYSVTVEPLGFVEHPKIPMSGASPDGAVGSDGLVEFKCPNTATHIAFLLSNEVEQKYQKQMLWQLACTGREWVDFVSFDPRMPVELQLRVRRFTRSHKLSDRSGLSDLEAEVRAFLGELDALENALRTQMRVAA